MQNAHGIAALPIKESCTVMFEERGPHPARRERQEQLAGSGQKGQRAAEPLGKDNSCPSFATHCQVLPQGAFPVSCGTAGMGTSPGSTPASLCSASLSTLQHPPRGRCRPLTPAGFVFLMPAHRQLCWPGTGCQGKGEKAQGHLLWCLPSMSP